VSVASVSPATRRIEFVLAAHTTTAPRTTAQPPGSEEYPRIPLRGKRLTGLQPGVDTREQNSRGGKAGRPGKGKGGPRKRR